MTDNRPGLTGEPRGGDVSLPEQRRILQLELTKVRNQASAARLEARAAEIELLMHDLRSAQPAAGSARDSTPAGDEPIYGTSISAAPIGSSHLGGIGRPRFESWDQLRVASSADQAAATGPRNWLPNDGETYADGFDSTENDVLESSPEAFCSSVVDDSSVADDRRIRRTDQPEKYVRRPRLLDFDGSSAERFAEFGGPITVELDPESDQADSRRPKPAAWFFSALLHVAILLVLAAIGIQTQRPKDQVALTGSNPAVNEMSVETFELEADEPESEPTESSPSEVEYDFSPEGEIVAVKIVADAPPAPPSPAGVALSSAASSAAMSLKSDSDAKIQFCGVEGGGNHFVYLVDCSGSMKAGFQSARNELLSSIEALTPKQRFYVIFFDAEPDYMRLRDAGRDEPRSVYATPENKAALKRWAMRISMDRGKAPYDPLRFALGLKPDVIFLLSDGEFPQGIEELLQQENKVVNLFGDSRPISIVHTISYHSQEGESRMRRIAEQNQGQYRHVPKP